MSKRGYSVTGIDLSESQLQRAKEKASSESLKIDLKNMMQEPLIIQILLI